MSTSRSFMSARRATVRPRRIAAIIAPVAVIALGAALVLPTANSGAAQATVGLGADASFAVVAGSGITNTGATTITGDVGSFPTTSQTGFGAVTLNGANHHGDAVTQQAKNDLTTAYNTAAGATPFTTKPVELGGSTLLPGVYRSGTFGITGTLTLDTQGDPHAVFIFQMASTLTTASNSNVVVLGGGTACNVFWQVGSSATLGTGSHLIGSVLASASITATTGATIVGRLLAGTAAVTLDNNTITTPVCAAAATTTTAAATPTTAGGGTTTPTTAPTGTPIVSPTTPTTAPGPGSPALPAPPGAPATPGTPGTPFASTPPGPSLPHTL
jgi:type VI secretion system secreted protein VgrG